MPKNLKKVISGVVTGLLAFCFMSAGIVKLTPSVSKEMHERMKKEFVSFAQVHPAVNFGYKIDPVKYMFQIGLIEFFGGALLVAGARFFKLLSSMVLASVMIGALYTLHNLGEPIEKMVPASVLLLLLFLKMNFLLSSTHPLAERKQEEAKKEQ